jgi:hypothetical protein
MNRVEEMEAAQQGMTLRVYRLQRQLRRLPLIPLNDGQREARDRVSAQLIRTARKDRCLPKINLMAGTPDADRNR